MNSTGKSILQEVILAIITLGISLLRRGKKHHTDKWNELNPGEKKEY